MYTLLFSDDYSLKEIENIATELKKEKGMECVPLLPEEAFLVEEIKTIINTVEDIGELNLTDKDILTLAKRLYDDYENVVTDNIEYDICNNIQEMILQELSNFGRFYSISKKQTK